MGVKPRRHLKNVISGPCKGTERTRTHIPTYLRYGIVGSEKNTHTIIITMIMTSEPSENNNIRTQKEMGKYNTHPHKHNTHPRPHNIHTTYIHTTHTTIQYHIVLVRINIYNMKMYHGNNIGTCTALLVPHENK